MRVANYGGNATAKVYACAVGKTNQRAIRRHVFDVPMTVDFCRVMQNCTDSHYETLNVLIQDPLLQKQTHVIVYDQEQKTIRHYKGVHERL